MPDRRSEAYQKGLQGERDAENYLLSQGMTCIARRYHSPYGEIDLIMLDDGMLAFVEVKARSSRTLLDGQMAVNRSKQRKIIQTALSYLNEHPEHADKLMRFDIVALSGDFIQHIPNAFQSSEW